MHAEAVRNEKELRQMLEVRGGEGKEKFLGEFLKRFLDAEKKQLEWSNDTADLDKINDVELLFATGYNVEFIRTHHRMRELLDAYESLKEQKKVDTSDDAALSMKDIYQRIRYGADGRQDGIRVNEVDREGSLTGRQIDLYDYAHLERIRKFYDLLDPRDKAAQPFQEIEKAFWAGGKMPFTLKKHDMKTGDATGDELDVKDLRELIQKPGMSPAEFEEYYATIQKSQTSLQYLSTLRDSSIMGHHAENGGHAQMRKGLGDEWVYVPVSGRMAAKYVRGDVGKTSERHRVGGHVHEMGYYEERTGMTVWYEAKAVDLWRGRTMDYQVFSATYPRTFKNFMALQTGEDAMADKKDSIMWFGRKETADGNDKRGKIYDAMRNHYDAQMREQRGYGITDLEAGDKIVTDIISVHFATNQQDWVMSFGKASGLYDPREMTAQTLTREDDAQRPMLVFYAKHPENVSVITKETNFSDVKEVGYGKIEIRGFTALAKYVQWRIEQGDVPGIADPGAVDVDFIKKMGEKPGKKKKKEVIGEEGGTEKEFAYDHEDDADAIVSVLHDVYGDSAESMLKILAEEVQEATVRMGDTDVVIRDDTQLKEQIAEYAEKQKGVMKALREITNEEAAPEAAKRFIKILRGIIRGEDALERKELVKKLRGEK